MRTSEDKIDTEDIFSLSLDEDLRQNKRIAVRYVRTDISLTITKKKWGLFNKTIPAKLLDISSKGLAIECLKKLPIKKKIILNLLFDDGQRFTISAKIVHRKGKKSHYGVKFDRYNNDLGDHILSSQNDLIFK